MRGHSATRSFVVTGVGYAVALLTLGVAVRESGWLTRLDGPFTGWLVDHRTHALDRIAMTVTVVRGPKETAALGVVVASILWWRTKRFGPSVVLLLTVAGAAAACTALEFFVGRDRPPVPLRLMVETDRSFPSGHVTATATLLFMSVMVLAPHASTARRTILTAVATLIVTLVAASRLYLGVHWLTDVLAKILLAALIVPIGRAVMRRVDTERSASERDLLLEQPAEA